MTAALIVAGMTTLGAQTAAADEPAAVPSAMPPLLPRDENVVTSDPIPTVQIDNGYVWAQAMIGSTVYAVGKFDNAREPLAAPGTSLTARSNVLAYNIDTGELLPFAPQVNGVIKAVAASPDGSRIYIGGSFNAVNGQSRWNIAALDAVTGELVPGFVPAIGGSGVYALTASGPNVYAGGLFTQANGTAVLGGAGVEQGRATGVQHAQHEVPERGEQDGVAQGLDARDPRHELDRRGDAGGAQDDGGVCEAQSHPVAPFPLTAPFERGGGARRGDAAQPRTGTACSGCRAECRAGAGRDRVLDGGHARAPRAVNVRRLPQYLMTSPVIPRRGPHARGSLRRARPLGLPLACSCSHTRRAAFDVSCTTKRAAGAADSASIAESGVRRSGCLRVRTVAILTP